MKAERDPKTGKWLIQYRYTDWQGKRRKSMKRGFATKREAEEWAREFLSKKSPDFNMKFCKYKMSTIILRVIPKQANTDKMQIGNAVKSTKKIGCTHP